MDTRLGVVVFACLMVTSPLEGQTRAEDEDAVPSNLDAIRGTVQ